MAAADMFEIHTPFPGVYALREHGVNLYLVSGTERALLIDTGWGFGDLHAAVTELTSLPVTVVITHGDPDHVSAVHQFTRALISTADLPVAEGSQQHRRTLFERVAARAPLPEGFDAEAWIDAPAPAYQLLEPGAVFDLGGRTLEVIPTPGHTPGAVCLLDAGAKLLVTGDTIVNGDILMSRPIALTLGEYAESLRRLLGRRAEFDTVLPGHGDPLPASVVEELEQGIAAILRGEVQGEPMDTYFGPATAARFETVGIYYDPQRE